MSREKWIPLERGKEIPLHGRYIVTRDLKPVPDVTLALPCWCYGNNKVTAYMPVSSVVENRDGWMSEYWGDNLPESSGWYLVSLQKIISSRIDLDKLYFELIKQKWLAVSPGYEVIAYKPFPKPYLERAETVKEAGDDRHV